ncbi:MAG TPA: UbiA family prenyltransferase [Actinomycetes bacterium]|nr:UbiA family prenyltransferase [Actinomycetes bacterium]
MTAVAVGLGAGAGLTAGRCALLGAAVLSGQLSIGWLNDLVDRDRDVAAGRPDKPLARGAVGAATVRAAATAAAVACLPLSLALGLAAGLTHLVAVASGWTYDLRLKATLLSPLPYAVSFGLLPSVVTLALPHAAWAPWWATAAGALLGIGIHGANALPDIEDDRRLGAAGLPARIGARATRALTAACLVAAALLLVLAPGGPPDAWGWAALAASLVLAGVAVGHDWPPAARTAFSLVVVLALLDVAVLLAHAGDWASALGTLRG